jgi:hypothetical protein
MSNIAGVSPLGGLGCELGAVGCSPGAMMAIDESPSTGPCGVQDPVPFGLGDAVPAKNPRARGGRICEKGPSRRAGISPRLVSGGDSRGTGPCPLAHGDSAEVREPQGGGDRETLTSRQLKEQFPHVLSKVYWDGGGVLARGVFASTVDINEAPSRHNVRQQGERETGQAQLEL